MGVDLTQKEGWVLLAALAGLGLALLGLVGLGRHGLVGGGDDGVPREPLAGPEPVEDPVGRVGEAVPDPKVIAAAAFLVGVAEPGQATDGVDVPGGVEGDR